MQLLLNNPVEYEAWRQSLRERYPSYVEDIEVPARWPVMAVWMVGGEDGVGDLCLCWEFVQPFSAIIPYPTQQEPDHADN